jgi:hypothetical protein
MKPKFEIILGESSREGLGTCEPAVSRRDGVDGDDHGSLHRDVADEHKLEGQLVRIEARALLEVVDGHLIDDCTRDNAEIVKSGPHSEMESNISSPANQVRLNPQRLENIQRRRSGPVRGSSLQRLVPMLRSINIGAAAESLSRLEQEKYEESSPTLRNIKRR